VARRAGKPSSTDRANCGWRPRRWLIGRTERTQHISKNQRFDLNVRSEGWLCGDDPGDLRCCHAGATGGERRSLFLSARDPVLGARRRAGGRGPGSRSAWSTSPTCSSASSAAPRRGQHPGLDLLRRHLGLSLGDRLRLALAARLGTTALTADRPCAGLRSDVPIELFRPARAARPPTSCFAGPAGR
jgi:hypothetical protein